MYTLIETKVRRGREWLEKDVRTESLKDILAVYDDCFFTLNHFTWEEPRVVDLFAMRSEMDHLNVTLEEWVVGRGDAVIETLGTAREVMEKHYVTSMDVWDAGFHVSLYNRGTDPQTKLNSNQARDILLTKEGVTYMDVYNNCLFTVNGFIHPTDVSTHGLCVMDANINANKTKDNRLGIIDFRSVGGFSYLPINTDTLVTYEGVEAKDRVSVKTSTSIKDKTLFLVLGGYLLELDGTCTSGGDTVVNLDFRHLDIVNMYLEAKDSLDFSNLLTDILIANEQSPWLELPIEELKKQLHSPSFINSSDFMVGLLLNPHSFIVAVHTPALYEEVNELFSTGLLGKYLSVTPPKGILKNSNQKLTEYRSIGTRECFVVVTNAERKRFFNSQTVEEMDSLPLAGDTESTNTPPEPTALKEILYYTTNP